MKKTSKPRQRHKLVLNLADSAAIIQLHSSIGQGPRLGQSDLVNAANYDMEHIAVLHPTTNHS